MFAWLQQLFSSPAEKPSPVAPALIIEETIETEALAPQPAPVKAVESDFGASWEQRSDANANFHNWLFCTKDDASGFDASELEKEVLDALDQIVKSKQSGANLVRRLPGL